MHLMQSKSMNTPPPPKKKFKRGEGVEMGVPDRCAGPGSAFHLLYCADSNNT